MWYRFGCMVDPSDSYSPAMVKEFYTSYAATVGQNTLERVRGVDQPSLTSTLVRRAPVDIFERMIQCFL